MADDLITGRLAAIEHRGRIAYNDYRAPPQADWDALIAAVDAVLAKHQPGPVAIVGALCKRHGPYRHFSISATESADVEACGDCQAAVWVSCDGCGRPTPLESCPTRAAIERALSGEDTTP